MIVKGKPRSGPAQLAAYLMRVGDGEHPTLIHLDYGDDDLKKAFIEWDSIGELTRGEKTLYHAQIAPEARYKMTPEEYLRAAEILAEELGMKNHPRAIVVHDGGDKPHAHVVFQRTDTETMTLWDDSYNYVKHERASLRMEQEFAHEQVPGKHAKRDREKQPEFPRQELTADDAQQEKRTGINTADRKAEISALYHAADSGPALKAALEEAGYMLASGERGYVVVDQTGGQSVLTRNTGLKKKELEVFMAAVPLATLPTVEEAKALQKAAGQRKAAAPAPDTPAPARVENAKPGVEASKFVMPPEAPQPPPEKAEPPKPAPRDEKLVALEKALAERLAEDLKKYRELHEHQLRQKQFELDKEMKDKTAAYDRIQAGQREALRDRQDEHRTGLLGFLDALKLRLNPTLAAEQAQARRNETALLERRLELERKDYIKLLEQTRQQDLDNTKERQAQQLRDVGTKGAEERDRYLREYREAERIREQVKEARERDRGLDPPRVR